MARHFQSLDLVALPVLDVPSSLALGQELLTRAKLPKDAATSLVRARKRLATAHEALQQAARARLAPEPRAPREQLEADRALDTSWSALSFALEAWQRLPPLVEQKKQSAARELAELLFPAGLKFVQLPYKAEWAESETRLARIDAEGLEPRLASLVGAAFVATLREAHAAYGKALGITAPLPKAEEAVSLRTHLDAFRTALRDYVLKVAALADVEDDESVALVENLLAPIAAWPSRKRDAAPAPSLEDADTVTKE
jgi:hypothetical protein